MRLRDLAVNRQNYLKLNQPPSEAVRIKFERIWHGVRKLLAPTRRNKPKDIET